jgi:hypothetical protein
VSPCRPAPLRGRAGRSRSRRSHPRGRGCASPRRQRVLLQADQLADEVSVIEQGQRAALEVPSRGGHRVDLRLVGPRPLGDGHARLAERLADGLGRVLVDSRSHHANLHVTTDALTHVPTRSSCCWEETSQLLDRGQITILHAARQRSDALASRRTHGRDPRATIRGCDRLNGVRPGDGTESKRPSGTPGGPFRVQDDGPPGGIRTPDLLIRSQSL